MKNNMLLSPFSYHHRSFTATHTLGQMMHGSILSGFVGEKPL